MDLPPPSSSSSSRPPSVPGAAEGNPPPPYQEASSSSSAGMAELELPSPDHRNDPSGSYEPVRTGTTPAPSASAMSANSVNTTRAASIQTTESLPRPTAMPDKLLGQQDDTGDSSIMASSVTAPPPPSFGAAVAASNTTSNNNNTTTLLPTMDDDTACISSSAPNVHVSSKVEVTAEGTLRVTDADFNGVASIRGVRSDISDMRPYRTLALMSHEIERSSSNAKKSLPTTSSSSEGVAFVKPARDEDSAFQNKSSMLPAPSSVRASTTPGPVPTATADGLTKKNHLEEMESNKSAAATTEHQPITKQVWDPSLKFTPRSAAAAADSSSNSSSQIRGYDTTTSVTQQQVENKEEKDNDAMMMDMEEKISSTYPKNAVAAASSSVYPNAPSMKNIIADTATAAETQMQPPLQATKKDTVGSDGGGDGSSPMDVEALEAETTTIPTTASSSAFSKTNNLSTIPVQEMNTTSTSSSTTTHDTTTPTTTNTVPSSEGGAKSDGATHSTLGGGHPNNIPAKTTNTDSTVDDGGSTDPHTNMMKPRPTSYPPGYAASTTLPSAMESVAFAPNSSSANNNNNANTSTMSSSSSGGPDEQQQPAPSSLASNELFAAQHSSSSNACILPGGNSNNNNNNHTNNSMGEPALSSTSAAKSSSYALSASGPPPHHPPAPAQPPINKNNNNNIINPNNNNNNSSPSNTTNVLHPTGRELKVEDALLYLDQVKLEFGDRPRIYNEFLEIMKNFKAQEVDTIGVINRVRSLFHGYNNLILGFNTFLPEGYKIEMRDLEPVFVGPGLSGTSHTPGYKPPPGPGGGGGGRGMPPGRGAPPQQQQQQHLGGGRGMGHPPPPAFGRGNLGGRGIPPPPGRGMMGRGPPTGPSGRGMPPGGGGRGGPPSQMGGPPGRGGMSLTGGRGAAPMTGGRGGPHQPPQGRMQAMPPQQQHGMPPHNVQQKQAQLQFQPTQQQHEHQQHQHHSLGMDTNQQRNHATRTIEFDHAIMYVTNIKKRFANQPRIYHTFLEILHTYQKEQRGIKEVLEQVSSLFADHPDLLREFTFFLPDAVQEQAKERLSRAAAEAEAKQRAAAVEAATKHLHQASVHQSAVDSGKLKSAPTGWRTTGNNVGGGAMPKVGKIGHNAGVEPMLPSGTQKFIDMTQPEGAGFESNRRPSVSGAAAKKTTQQELFVYNAGVERQFFDLVKVALTSFSRDGQAYAEFIKTLDMYAQEILSRNDMLGYVERLLGKHKDLFEEFKRIINAVGSPDAPTHDDSWHSVPLSEIDFSRCRRCSPSYRALPRDYPNPPCSERSEEEAKILNDTWVSLPMGSEENSTFRHMRKNQYEETLFQCEDMRFEIDMCIDSNAATLQRLIKISDELQFLSENELLLTKGTSVKKSLVPDGAGFGGKIYQYTLDGRVLGVIHKLSIKRIYGDDGDEMLELCFKNPAVALPIVVNRLRQKDEEWRAARDMLNKKWRDLAELNYYMSLDHRSITWRATDKRATSTRALVAEIKDRATHNGFEGEAASSARIEKAKEEHGAFYEVTMGCAVARKMDLTGLPLPTRTLFTPHMSFMYDSTSWAQHDAYRLISFALERGSVNPSDKERCHRLWCDFIGPWFGLSLAWMQSPAALYTGSSEPLEDDDDDNTSTDNGNYDEVVSCNAGEVPTNNDSNTASIGKAVEEVMTISNTTPAVSNGYFSTSNHVPFPPETYVSTTFGEGKIIQFIEQDGVYEVSIPPESDNASTAYLRVDAIYGTLFPVEPSLLTEQLRENDQEEPERTTDQLIIGTQCLYLFFRLHQILIRRLTVAKKLAFDVSNDLALGKHIEKLTTNGDVNEGEKRYGAFLDLVYSLIDAGSAEVSEGGKYEDRVMHLLGNNAYELTTMDKLISHVLKHIQNMANDDVLQNMIEIYRRHRLAGTFKPSAFREEASLMSEGENMFAFQICDITQTDQKICHCEFLGCIAEDVEDEDNVESEMSDNKRGINDNGTDDADACAHDSKRLKRIPS